MTGENGYPNTGYQAQPAAKKNYLGFPRNKGKANKLLGNKRKTKYYIKGSFSKHSLFFLGAALLQGTYFVCVVYLTRPIISAVLITGLIIPSLIVGDFNSDLIIDNNGTVYTDLSCSERRDLRDNLSRGYEPDVDEVQKWERRIIKIFCTSRKMSRMG